MLRRTAALTIAVALVFAACGHKKRIATAPSSTSSSSTSTATSSPSTSAATSTSTTRGTTTTRRPTTTRATSAPAAALGSVRIKLTPAASFDQPLAMAVHPGDNAVYVAEKTGKVRALAGGAVALDVSALVVTGSEQGLLGITFSPDGSHLYVNYTERSHGDTRVVEYAFSGGHADPATARQLLAITQPYANHNGGNVITGPDGKLWIGMGDGGSANDPGNRAQNRGELLGKLLRIDPTPSGGQPYTVPPDNPFVGQAGVRGEIWAYGLRNPWRFEFDRANHDLWIADVGQNAWEEIDWRPASSKGGENYGWKCYEGNHQANCPAVSGALLPVEEYSHSATGGCSITGGFVYRGSKIPGLVGAYVYADFCVGRLHAIKLSGGRVSERKDLGVTLENLSSFGQDANGELYALSLGGTVDRIDPA